MSAEEFIAKLCVVTGAQDKGTLLPFLKMSLPSLRVSIRKGEQAELQKMLRLGSAGGDSPEETAVFFKFEIEMSSSTDGSGDGQQQLKEYREKVANMIKEMRQTKRLCIITQLEKNTLEGKLKLHELVAERNALQAKVTKMEQNQLQMNQTQQQQQRKDDEEDEMEEEEDDEEEEEDDEEEEKEEEEDEEEVEEDEEEEKDDEEEEKEEDEQQQQQQHGTATTTANEDTTRKRSSLWFMDTYVSDSDDDNIPSDGQGKGKAVGRKIYFYWNERSSLNSSNNDSSAEKGEKQFTQTHDKEHQILEARIMEPKRRKAMAQSSTSSVGVHEQKENALAGQFKAILKRMNVLEKKQRQYEAETKASIDQFSQLHKEQKAFLGKISELEKQHQMLAQQMKTDSVVKFNFWDANACHDSIAICGPNFTMVNHKGKTVNGYGFRNVFAKYSILESVVVPSDIVYFELNVKNMKCGVFFGFAVKHRTPLNEGIGRRTGTYAYLGNGNYWINVKKKEGNETFDTGDTVGCGVNFANNQVFFTKNGHRIGAPNDFRISSSPSVDLLFPFVSLWRSDDKIEANFGPEFMFDVSTFC